MVEPRRSLNVMDLPSERHAPFGAHSFARVVVHVAVGQVQDGRLQRVKLKVDDVAFGSVLHDAVNPVVASASTRSLGPDLKLKCVRDHGGRFEGILTASEVV